MKKCCENCIYARLICNKELLKKGYVGCAKFGYINIDDKKLETKLASKNFKTTESIYTGWIHLHVPPYVDFEKYKKKNNSMAGVLANNHLIIHKTSVCSQFRTRFK